MLEVEPLVCRVRAAHETDLSQDARQNPRYYECPNHINRDKGCPTSNLPAEAIEMAVASNLASLASNPAMMRVLQEHLPQLALRRNSRSRLVYAQPEPPSQKKGNRPTKRAIRMANALVLEQMLHAGQFRSLADIRMTFGITCMLLSKTLDMLDHTPGEISTILRETY